MWKKRLAFKVIFLHVDFGKVSNVNRKPSRQRNSIAINLGNLMRFKHTEKKLWNENSLNSTSTTFLLDFTSNFEDFLGREFCFCRLCVVLHVTHERLLHVSNAYFTSLAYMRVLNLFLGNFKLTQWLLFLFPFWCVTSKWLNVIGTRNFKYSMLDMKNSELKCCHWITSACSFPVLCKW